jgi:hypothetical protein
MLNNVRSIASCFVALSFVVAACGDGDSSDEGNGTGGGAGKGGSAGSSGSTGKGGSSGSTGKGGSSGSTGKGGTAGSSGAGTGGSSAGTSGSAGAGSGGEGGDDTGSGGDAGTGNGAGGAGDGGMPGTGGDDGTGGAPEGGMGGEPSIGAGGNGTAGEAGAPVTGSGGAGGEGGAPGPAWDVIDNPGFELTDSDTVPPRNWTVTGTPGAVTYSWSNSYAHATQSPEGPGYLDLWLASAYTVDVSQVVSPIPDGSYTLRIAHYGGPYTEQYVYVKGYDETNAAAQLDVDTVETGNAFVELVIDDIPVTSGQITIGIYSVAAAGNWSHFDDVSLTLNP